MGRGFVLGPDCMLMAYPSQITRIVKARDQLPTLKRVLRKHYAVRV